MKYRIRLDDACTVFSLYNDGELTYVRNWVGDLLLEIAKDHSIDVSASPSESYMLSTLQNHGLDIDVEDI